MAAPFKVPAQLYIALISLAVVIADQWSKAWAVNALSDRTIDVVWKLQFHLTSNTGFAFSTGQGLGPFLGLVALLVVVVLWRMRDGFSGSVSIFALGLILGGATGNLIDRAFRGAG
ncbi:MAG: signal peptidase II, partial [Acidimicrobiales bacterium]|nr:signal peptidase II [Acidimicrobiales bacterium]